jgi:hypothetical protein
MICAGNRAALRLRRDRQRAMQLRPCRAAIAPAAPLVGVADDRRGGSGRSRQPCWRPTPGVEHLAAEHAVVDAVLDPQVVGAVHRRAPQVARAPAHARTSSHSRATSSRCALGFARVAQPQCSRSSHWCSCRVSGRAGIARDILVVLLMSCLVGLGRRAKTRARMSPGSCRFRSSGAGSTALFQQCASSFCSPTGSRRCARRQPLVALVLARSARWRRFSALS